MCTMYVSRPCSSSIPKKKKSLHAIEGGNLVALGFKGEVKSYLCRTNEGKVLLCCYVELPHPTSKAEVRNDFFFHYDLVHTCLEFETSVGKIRLSQPAIFWFDLTFACNISDRDRELTWHPATSSGKINSWLTNHYFPLTLHYFPVNWKALIKLSTYTS